MLQLGDYDVYIFDCDGVILDSNQLKIEAMKNVLEAHFSDQYLNAECINYFRHNFGKSRFHHIAHFLDVILDIDEGGKDELKNLLIQDFSKQCRSLYLSAAISPSIVSFLEQCKGKKYVASGSEESELRDVFAQRGLDSYFNGVYGSPISKAEIIKHILEQEQTSNAVMFGDAESDMVSAQQNHIDFVFYSPYSNVKEKMTELCNLHKYPIISDFSKLRS
ncbi:HAD family hydrolase [Shewanella xiamenensis]|uniref:HAD family hydrolase n=1 Tax=Shewanella xiamenensis TaxID=332186 RepID=UPI0004D9C23B|nr:HAD hydrolase-like protein [Shewanella xiamenensis]KEK27748.1 haloacid dehalogenase-like hydrolase [Shewanella xiamenensis]